MQVIEPAIDRASIETAIREARHPGHDPARWALPLLLEADRRAAGAWRLLALEDHEALALWLPPHAGEACHGDRMPLAGGAGATLGTATAWLHVRGEAYATANPSCWGRIAAARDGTSGPLVVAPFAVGDRTGPPPGTSSHYIVIDGLHRALGWALHRAAAGPVTPPRAHASADTDERLRVFAAGPPI